jgi:hypothetical protein
MTALQQQQPPVSLSLPISLPASESPNLVMLRHSSANADLIVHATAIDGQGVGLWEGNLNVQQQPIEVRACPDYRRCHSRYPLTRSTQAADAVGDEEQERQGGRVLSCLDSLAVPLHQKQPEPSFINNIATSMAK